MGYFSKSKIEKMQELSSCIKAWKDALKFGGSCDAKFREACKANVSSLGRQLVELAKEGL